jgi:putative photosynthetic complex assembly protein
MQTYPDLTRQTSAKRGIFSPAGALIGLILLVTIISVAYLRASGVSPEVSSLAPPTAQRFLRFLDTPEGDVAVVDFTTNERISTISGEAGFVRGALRALVRERRNLGKGSEEPFQLVARLDGRLTLEDALTGEKIDLRSFGPTNAANFTQLLGTQLSTQRQISK